MGVLIRKSKFIFVCLTTQTQSLVRMPDWRFSIKHMRSELSALEALRCSESFIISLLSNACDPMRKASLFIDHMAYALE